MIVNNNFLCGLSVLLFVSLALRGFSLGTPVFQIITSHKLTEGEGGGIIRGTAIFRGNMIVRFLFVIN